MHQRSRAPAYHNCHYNLLVLLVIVSFSWQSCLARISRANSNNGIGYNPNIPCAGKNKANIWKPCEHGGYIVNDDPANCDDIYVCYRGLGEFCDKYNKCGHNAICTVCGTCEKCESPEKCSDFRLCPGIGGLFKRFMQTPLTEFNDMDE